MATLLIVSCRLLSRWMGVVLKDIRAAALQEVTDTPTVFINGKRVNTARTVEELDALIAQAKSNAVQ